jgi:hypothetical protein
MANVPDSAAMRHGFGALVRTACWGGGASVALVVAVLAARSDAGASRIALALSSASARTLPSRSSSNLAAETRRLTEQVRLLAMDRERLLLRLATIERHLEDVTGSIRRREAMAQVTGQTQPAQPAQSFRIPPAQTTPITVPSASWRTGALWDYSFQSGVAPETERPMSRELK